jgi:predicted dinucleotide-binding enzyme
MKIGIIGAGEMCGALAGCFGAAGYEVSIASTGGIEAARTLAGATGAIPVQIRDAVRGVDVVLLPDPFSTFVKLPRDSFVDTPVAVPSVNTSNYSPDSGDPHVADIEDGSPESLSVSKQFGRLVTEAFNGISARSFVRYGLPEDGGKQMTVAVVGDNVAANYLVCGLIGSMGFYPVDAGKLPESWRLQSGNPAYCGDLFADQVVAALAAAIKNKGIGSRATDAWQFAVFPHP